MDDLKKSAISLADMATAYVTTLYDHTKVSASIKATNAVSETVLVIIVSSLLFAATCFLGLGAGLLIGHALNNVEVGFFIIAGCYFLIAIILFFLKKQITMSVKNFLIKKVYEE